MASGRTWAYAVAAGDQVTGTWPLADFLNESYHLRVHGPNGFYREFRGNAADPDITITLEADAAGDAVLTLTSRNPQQRLKAIVEDMSYGAAPRAIEASGPPARKGIPLQKSHGWYDLRITVEGSPGFAQRFAGRIESGRESRTDPLMGGS
jgi:phospholipase C